MNVRRGVTSAELAILRNCDFEKARMCLESFEGSKGRCSTQIKCGNVIGGWFGLQHGRSNIHQLKHIDMGIGMTYEHQNDTHHVQKVS